MAIEGKLVPQDPNDEPASVLLNKIRKEKARLVKEGKLKKKELEETSINDDEKPFEIPDSWEWCRISHLGEIITGGTPSKENQAFYGNEYPFYKPGDLDKGLEIQESADGLSQMGFDASRKLRENSILVTCIGSVGKTGLIKKAGACNQQINAIMPFEELFPKYIYYAICSPTIQAVFRKDAGQTTLLILNKSNFGKILFPLPPLAEQRRIVAKIEELMPMVEEYGKAQEELDKLNAQLPEKLKKSILQDAIQGRLVPQDNNDEPASVLLDKIRKEKARLVKEGKLKKKDLEETPINDDEIPFEIPDSWEWVRFGGLVSTSIGKTPARGDARFWSTNGLPWVSISDMKQGGIIVSTKECVSNKAAKEYFHDDIIKCGTLLMSFKLTVGRTSILGINAFHNEAIISIKTYADEYNSTRDYLSYILPVVTNWGDSKEAIKGKTLNAKSIYNLFIPLPPLAEQRRIVAKIEELFRLIDGK